MTKIRVSRNTVFGGIVNVVDLCGRICALVVFAICFSICFGSSLVLAAELDAAAIMKKAFDKYNSAEMIFATEYLMDYGTDAFDDDKDYELYEQVNANLLYDRVNGVVSGEIRDGEHHMMIPYYVDIKQKLVYYESVDWNWDVAGQTDLSAPKEHWIVDGDNTVLCVGENWHYDGVEKISRNNPYTNKPAEYTCHKVHARIYIKNYGDDESDTADNSHETTVCYYVTTDGNDLVYAKDMDGRFVNSVDLICVSKADQSKAVTIPKAVREKALYAEYTETEVGGVCYRVRHIGGKACLEVTRAKNKKNITIRKSVKILGISYPVTVISSYAFMSNTKMENLTINADITDIGNRAFEGVNTLKTITIKSKKLKKIGKSAFDTNSKKLKIRLSGSKKYKKKIKKLINKSRSREAKKKTKLMFGR